MYIYNLKPPVPTPPISDDTDLQFWAEDELSNTESKHKLIGRHKRRYSLAHRNRNETYKSLSLIKKSLLHSIRFAIR